MSDSQNKRHRLRLEIAHHEPAKRTRPRPHDCRMTWPGSRFFPGAWACSTAKAGPVSPGRRAGCLPWLPLTTACSYTSPCCLTQLPDRRLHESLTRHGRAYDCTYCPAAGFWDIGCFARCRMLYAVSDFRIRISFLLRHSDQRVRLTSVPHSRVTPRQDGFRATSW